MIITKLDVYLDKILVGTLAQKTSDGGALSFVYDAKYLSSKNPQKLSMSLPLRTEAFGDKEVKPFFSGLLPDNEQLDLLSKQLKTSPKNPFAILSKIGRDCAGAVEILTPSEKPIGYDEGKKHAITEGELRKIFDELHTNPLLAGGKKRARLSLAGAQSKLAVISDEKKKSVPELSDGAPSTHILKPPMLRFPDSVFNEFFCMKLATKVGLEVAEVFLRFAQEQPYLLIRRYDRTKNRRGFVTRIHQEDFCQALGVMPEMKYQGVDGGPGIKESIELINKNSSQPAKDNLKFINAVIFNYVIGNSDAHGKNFSFLYADNQTKLAPLYDLVCTSAYKQLNHKMSMRLGRVFDPSRVALRDWYNLSPFKQNRALETMLEKLLITYSKSVLNQANFLKNELQKSGISSPVFDDIIKVIEKRSQKISGYFQA